MASEYYDTLASHTSWTRLLFDFILNPQLGPQSRLGRTYEAHKSGRKMILTAKPAEKMEKSDSGLALDE
jgi:sphingolipid delta-4 desaturase